MKNKEKILKISKKLGLTHISSCLSVLPLLEEIYAKKKPTDKVQLCGAHSHLAHLLFIDPDNIEEKVIKKGEYSWLDIVNMSGLTKSKTESRRLIEDGATDKDGEVINSPHKKIVLEKPMIIKLGKHRFIKIVPED